MKKILTAQEIIDLHVKTSGIIQETHKTGDYKRGNREFKKITKIQKILSEDIDLAKVVYGILLRQGRQGCLKSAMNAAANCLRLDIYTKEAEQLLEETSQRTDIIGDMRYEAEMTLRVWRGEVPGCTL